MNSGIYQIKNKLNEHRYIGSTKNFKKRWNIHKADLKKQKHHSFVLQRAVNKYGIENFVFEILEECEVSSLPEKEQKYLDEHNPEYNILKNIDGSNRTFTEETRKKMSDAKIGISLTEKHKKKISNANLGQNNGMYGKTHTNETKLKISENKGKIDREKHHWTKLTNSQIEEMIELYNSGKSKQELARKYFVTESCIIYNLKQNKCNLKKNNLTKKLNWDIVRDIRKQFTEGKKSFELIKIFNLSYSQIRRIIKNQQWKE